VNDLSTFVISLTIIRIIQGAGDAFITIGSFSLLATYFSKAEYQSAIALLNANVGMGIAIGPLIGSGILEVFSKNYCYGLIIFACVHSALIILA